VRAANSTDIARAVQATVKYARPKKRTLSPVAVELTRQRKTSPTAAVTPRGAGKNNSGTLVFKKMEKSCYIYSG
jgi:hypothetical protein